VWDVLAATAPGKGGEIQLTDALLTLAQRGPGVIGMAVDAVRHDAGDKLGFLGATLSYALDRADLRDGTLALMRRLLEEAAARQAA
jgi:UTP--glucose-1-phosphate uridylyltransferase